MEPVRDYELQRFFTHVIQVLEGLNVPYMVVGGFAVILYGEPRLTVDVDIVVDMQPEHVTPFVAAFPPDEYYVNEDTVRDALRRRYLFNVIESSTGAKVDMVPLGTDAFSRAVLGRRQRLVYDQEGHTATFIGLEDMIVAKLLAHRSTGSDKHLRDARGVLVIQRDDVNVDVLRGVAQAAGVLSMLEDLLRGE
jgi:hypothetical protein